MNGPTTFRNVSRRRNLTTSPKRIRLIIIRQRAALSRTISNKGYSKKTGRGITANPRGQNQDFLRLNSTSFRGSGINLCLTKRRNIFKKRLNNTNRNHHNLTLSRRRTLPQDTQTNNPSRRTNDPQHRSNRRRNVTTTKVGINGFQVTSNRTDGHRKQLRSLLRSFPRLRRNKR